MLAGDPALDFANTLHWRGGREVDFLPDYRSLVEWSVPAGLLREMERDELAAAAVEEADSASAIHALALKLRAAWRDELAAHVAARGGHGSPLPSPLPALLSDLLTDSPLLMGLKPSGALDAGQHLRLPVLRIAFSIASLYLMPVDRQIGRCEGDPCGGFFLNTSRSKPRRWCSMESCGNRAKVRQFRSRMEAEEVR